MATLILDEFWVAVKSEQGEAEMLNLQEHLDSCSIRN